MANIVRAALVQAERSGDAEHQSVDMAHPVSIDHVLEYSVRGRVNDEPAAGLQRARNLAKRLLQVRPRYVLNKIEHERDIEPLSVKGEARRVHPRKRWPCLDIAALKRLPSNSQRRAGIVDADSVRTAKNTLQHHLPAPASHIKDALPGPGVRQRERPGHPCRYPPAGAGRELLVPFHGRTEVLLRIGLRLDGLGPLRTFGNVRWSHCRPILGGAARGGQTTRWQ